MDLVLQHTAVLSFPSEVPCKLLQTHSVICSSVLGAGYAYSSRLKGVERIEPGMSHSPGLDASFDRP